VFDFFNLFQISEKKLKMIFESDFFPAYQTISREMHYLCVNLAGMLWENRE